MLHWCCRYSTGKSLDKIHQFTHNTDKHTHTHRRFCLHEKCFLDSEHFFWIEDFIISVSCSVPLLRSNRLIIIKIEWKKLSILNIKLWTKRRKKAVKYKKSSRSLWQQHKCKCFLGFWRKRQKVSSKMNSFISVDGYTPTGQRHEDNGCAHAREQFF